MSEAEGSCVCWAMGGRGEVVRETGVGTMKGCLSGRGLCM